MDKYKILIMVYLIDVPKQQNTSSNGDWEYQIIKFKVLIKQKVFDNYLAIENK